MFQGNLLAKVPTLKEYESFESKKHSAGSQPRNLLNVLFQKWPRRVMQRRNFQRVESRAIKDNVLN